MEKIYSRANSTGSVAHIFNHSTGKVLCGTNLRWICEPNKRLMERETMKQKHGLIAERRGGPNPYKFVCGKCLDKITIECES